MTEYKPGDNTFVKITNNDIFDKLCHIEHHVIRTNGKVKLNRWIATTALSLTLILIGCLGYVQLN